MLFIKILESNEYGVVGEQIIKKEDNSYKLTKKNELSKIFRHHSQNSLNIKI